MAESGGNGYNISNARQSAPSGPEQAAPLPDEQVTPIKRLILLHLFERVGRGWQGKKESQL